MNKLQLLDELQSVRTSYESLANLACDSRQCSSQDVGEVLNGVNQSLENLTSKINNNCPNF